MAQHDQVIANASGAVVRGDINDALAAIFTLSSGATAPGTTVAYQLWADTTTGLLKQRNAANSAWVTLGTLATYKLGLSTVGTAIDDDDIDGDNILTLPPDGNVFAFTGTQTVDEIATVGVGTEVELHFGSARTLTHSSDLDLPGGANITTADGDVGRFREVAPGDWVCTSYTRGNGLPLAIIDEDDMSSDSAVHVPTQQSVKAYVDAAAGAAGNIGQVVYAQDNTVHSTTSQIFTSGQGALPSAGAGIEALSLSVTPTAADSIFLVEVHLQAGGSTEMDIGATLLVDGAVVGAQGVRTPANANSDIPLTMRRMLTAFGDTSAHTIAVRYGRGGAGGTAYLNRTAAGATMYGATPVSHLTVTEILQ